MEKSITAGLEEYIRTIPGMKEIDAKQCSPLVLAYVGDCVYDLIIKTMVEFTGEEETHDLYLRQRISQLQTTEERQVLRH